VHPSVPVSPHVLSNLLATVPDFRSIVISQAYQLGCSRHCLKGDMYHSQLQV